MLIVKIINKKDFFLSMFFLKNDGFYVDIITIYRRVVIIVQKP